MKIILFAHQNWGVQAIRTLIKTEHEIKHVFTHPLSMDKYEKIWYDSVVNECIKYNIPVEEKTNVDDFDIQTIKQISPDLILSVSWRRLIPRSIFQIAKYGAINFHDGLLPKYRGFAPINWCIINGESEAGLTAHFIDDNADTGHIILQKKVNVEANDTAKIVYDKLLSVFPELLTETLHVVTNDPQFIDQKNLEKGFFCTRRFPHDGQIDWHQNRYAIHNLIRALSDPYPNAFCFYDGKKIYIKNAKLADVDYRGPPGRICSITSDGLIVTCGTNYMENQALLITEISVDEKSCHPKDFFTKLWSDFV